ncbi:hypothetical protein VTL71DRAFT_5959 [Oculimacula yallundae]|uniref:Heterokaryon incompatibility domain-containing protein n=1 Tax=Oculimacula yallundae TaxID=86028 RepID=A0ABR4BZ30_9HELO
MATSEWQDLVLNEVNEHDVYHGRVDGSVDKPFPVKKVQISTADPSTIAILSWRWDGTHEMTGSKNIFCAIHQARKLGIEYLFIDVISINQQLPGDELLRQVVEFSKLYGMIQVIATYDDLRVKGCLDEDFSTICRPWILSEAKGFTYNYTRVVHVGHIKEAPLTILGVLSGSLSMVSILDLKYIMPSRSHLLQTSYNKMCRHDYLLTAAICCEACRQETSMLRCTLWKESPGIVSLVYERYTIQVVGNPDADFRVGNSDDSNDIYSGAAILLDGKEIARWTEIHSKLSPYFLFKASDQGESVITTALQVKSYFNESYAANEDSDDEKIGSTVIKGPTIQAYVLDLPSLGICRERHESSS